MMFKEGDAGEHFKNCTGSQKTCDGGMSMSTNIDLHYNNSDVL